MIGPFLGQFGPKRAILGTLVTEFFLGTSKFEIYMKKQSRIRREMVVLGGGAWETSLLTDAVIVMGQVSHYNR